METQTSLDLKTGREQVLRIAGAFLILYLWRNLAYGLTWLATGTGPVIIGNNGLGLTGWLWMIAEEILIALPLLFLLLANRITSSLTSEFLWRPFVRSRWYFLGWTLPILVAVRYFSYSMQQHHPGQFWPHYLMIIGFWPITLVAVISWLLPNSSAPSRSIARQSQNPAFHPESAIQSWRDELIAQSKLTPDAVRELEMHLSDFMADLQKSGLDSKQAFQKARERVGCAEELGREFEKVDPMRQARQRLLWVISAFFGLYIWERFFYAIWWGVLPSYVKPIVLFGASSPDLFIYTPVLVLAVAVSRGYFATITNVWRKLIQSRLRLAVTACFLLMIVRIADAYWGFSSGAGLPPAARKVMAIQELALANVWPALLIALMVVLLPAEKAATSSRAA